MMASKSLSIAALCGAVGIAACEFPTAQTTGNPVGVGAVTAQKVGAGYRADPSLSFYRVNSASFVSTASARDSCFLTGYSANPGGSSNAPPIGAGAFVTVSLGARIDTLRRAAGDDETYRSTVSGGIPYTPGDSMIFTVDGEPSGFPASTFRGRTAEAFTVNPLQPPEVGAPIQVSWTPAAGAGAVMLMSFRYASGSASTFNQQVACTFVDDGSGTVPGPTAVPWLQATTRDMIAQRMRAIFTQVDVPRSFFNVVSTFDWPTPTSP